VLFFRVFANQNPRLRFTRRTLNAIPLFPHPSISLSPLLATHTSRSQISENTTALSPLLATHTDFAPVTPVFATHTKTTGVYSNNSHFGPSPVSFFARSFHSLRKECFTTLLQSSASALFLKIAGVSPYNSHSGTQKARRSSTRNFTASDQELTTAPRLGAGGRIEESMGATRFRRKLSRPEGMPGPTCP
jgi:hypothetical protein